MASRASTSAALIAASAPNLFASSRRSGDTSTAMIRTPMAAPSRVALRPTGPWPNTVMVVPPGSAIRLMAPKAVPVPHETAAPSAKDSSSGRSIRVPTGTFIYGAWAPSPVMP